MLVPDQNIKSPGGKTTAVKRYPDPAVVVKVSESDEIETAAAAAESQESSSAFPHLTANRLVKTDASKALQSVAALTQHAIVVADALGDLKTIGVATNGQLLVGSTGTDPVLATLTAGSGISITNAAGSITIAVSSIYGLTADERFRYMFMMSV